MCSCVRDFDAALHRLSENELVRQDKASRQIQQIVATLMNVQPTMTHPDQKGISPDPERVKALMNLLLLFMNNASNPEPLMQTRSAYEVVWGYDDGLVNVVNNINVLLEKFGT